MAFYPILIELSGMPCLVAGGGAIALHKAELLLSRGADVTVVAPKLCDGLRALAEAAGPTEGEPSSGTGQLRLVERAVKEADAEGKRLVVDATGDPEAVDMLSAVCKRDHIPYDCASRGGSCTAIFPAVSERGRTVVAVSTKGASPAACAYLRDRLAEEMPAEMDGILDAMASLRPLAKASFPDQPVRRLFFRRCFAAMVDAGRALTEEEIGAILEEVKQNSL